MEKIFLTTFNLVSLLFTISRTALVGGAGSDDTRKYRDQQNKKDFFHGIVPDFR
jgi:hypothetical protein